MNLEIRFKLGDIVWGKVKGYPWWPGKIIETPPAGRPAKFIKNANHPAVKARHYHVRFIGHESWSELSFEKVEDFSQSFEKYSQTKDRKLRDAISEAQKLLNISSDKLGEQGHLPAESKINYTKTSRKKAVEGIYDPEPAQQQSSLDLTKIEEIAPRVLTDTSKPPLVRSRSTLFEAPVQLDPTIPHSHVQSLPNPQPIHQTHSPAAIPAKALTKGKSKPLEQPPTPAAREQPRPNTTPVDNDPTQTLQNEAALVQAVELELSTHVTHVLDAAHSGYKLSDTKALDILRSLDTLGGIQMSYQALVTSWIGRYLKTLQLLLRILFGECATLSGWD